jgi:hypothetical protein
VKRSPSSSITPFSLFDGDLLNRTFGRLGLHSRRAVEIAGRCAVVIGATWTPMATFALIQRLYSNRIDARNFFADYAAYAQFLIALPLFIVAERVCRAAHVATMFDRVEEMRVVPFDFKSAVQLMAATVGSVATALPLLRIEGPLREWLDLLSAVLKRGG